VQYLVLAEGVRAHHAAALGLLDAGAGELAGVHLAHPVAELLPGLHAGLDPAFAELGADLDRDLRAAAAAFTARADAGTIGAAVGAADATLARAVNLVAGDVAATAATAAAVAAELLRTVATYTAEAVTGGEIAVAPRYEDAWGYLRRARAVADAAGLVTGALAAALGRLDAALPAILAPAPDPAAVRAAVSDACAAIAPSSPDLVTCESARS